MATNFIAGNYYKDSSREVVYLVTSRTKCFVTYKKFWISDLINRKSYQDGKIKVRFTEDGSEYVLIDGFCEIKSSKEYVITTEEDKEVKEVFELSEDNKKVIKAIVKLDPAGRSSWNHLARIAYGKLIDFVECPYDNCRDVYESALLVLNTISLEDKARVKDLVKGEESKEVKEVKGYIVGDFVEIPAHAEDIAEKTRMHIAIKTDGRKVVGFPSHAIARYENILLNAGYNLTVYNREVNKEVKEYYSAIHKHFIKVGQKFRYVDLENDELQDVVFEDANGRGTVLNFRAIDKDGNKFNCDDDGSLFVVTVSNCDCLKSFDYLTFNE